MTAWGSFFGRSRVFWAQAALIVHNHVFFNTRIIVVATVRPSVRPTVRSHSLPNELDARTIHVEGCVLSILCGGENMTRIK